MSPQRRYHCVRGAIRNFDAYMFSRDSSCCVHVRRCTQRGPSWRRDCKQRGYEGRYALPVRALYGTRRPKVIGWVSASTLETGSVEDNVVAAIQDDLAFHADTYSEGRGEGGGLLGQGRSARLTVTRFPVNIHTVHDCSWEIPIVAIITGSYL